jgi:pyruvate dehydrogenase E2 component (dihydrolipoamide acetyltransferase)
MAKFEFKLPDIGEGVTEGEIVGWLAKVGDRLTENQDMVEVMTDKATVTIGAPKTGTVVELRGAVGDTVPVGSVIVVLETGAGDVAVAKPAASATPAAAAPAPSASSYDGGPVATAAGDIRSSLPGVGLAPSQKAPKASPSTPPPAPQSPTFFTEQPLAAPATRKLARELGVDLKRVEPTGKGGRVTREDVESASRGQSATETAVTPSAAPAAPIPSVEIPKAAPLARSATETRVPIRGMRKRIFENMARSKRTAAHFTYADECDATGLIAMRNRLAARAEAKGVKLTYLPFIVKAVVRALKVHPNLNALVDDATQEIVLRGNYDIGIATSTEHGLIVPVLREADRLSLIEIAQEIARLGAAAKANRINPQDLGGSSFTITSLGKLGGLFATPVINYPEVAILGIHEIKRRPVVRDDQIVIGAEMILSLSFDHRIIDGNVGAAFAQEIIGLLEEPERLLLEA